MMMVLLALAWADLEDNACRAYPKQRTCDILGYCARISILACICAVRASVGARWLNALVKTIRHDTVSLHSEPVATIRGRNRNSASELAHSDE